MRIFGTPPTLSYIAFKALEERGGALVSPMQGTRWAWTVDGLAHLVAKEGDLERHAGIFASVYWEASLYNGKLHLVVPDPDYDVIVGEEGWRAGGAYAFAQIEGGTDLLSVAREILSADRQGFPQIEGILSWCQKLVEDPSEVFNYMSSQEVYQLGLDCPDEEWDEKISHALANFGGSYELYLAGVHWKDGRFTPEIREALMDRGESHDLLLAVLHWPEDRWTMEMTMVLATWGSGHELLVAGAELPDERWHPAITEALVASEESDNLLLAGIYWSDTRWDPRIAQKLLDCGKISIIKKAVLFWKEERLLPEMRQCVA